MARKKEDAKIWFADIEAYSYKYWQKHKDIKGYAFIQKDLEGNFIFDVNMEKFFDKVFSQEETRHKIFYHFGGKYDWHFFLSHLSRRAEKKKSHNFTFFSKGRNIFYMTYTIKTRLYIKDENGKCIPTGKVSPNGTIQYRSRKITKTFTFMDSYKHWPFALENIGKAVGLDKLDYEDYDITTEFKRNADFILWKEGKAYDYLHRDVDIPIEFFKRTRDIYDISQSYTVASDAFKEMCSYNENLKYSRRWLGEVSVWQQIKMSFVGGFTWVNPIYQLLPVKDIYKYDINSAYPGVMRYKPLPYGEPVYYDTGIPDRLRYYEVYFTRATAKSIPFMSKGKLDKQLQTTEDLLNDISFIEFSDLEEEYPTVLQEQYRVMSDNLLEFFKEWYDIEDLQVRFLYEFKTRYGMFDEYIDKYAKLKEEEEDPARKLIWKLRLNTNFGRLAMGIDFDKGEFSALDYILTKNIKIKETKNTLYVNGKTATMYDDGMIFWKKMEPLKEIPITNKDGKKELIHDLSYIPIAEQITTMARILLLKDVLTRPEMLVYTDTDSIHTLCPMEDILDIHPTRLGAWKFEGKVELGIYRRPKHYYNINIQEPGKEPYTMLKGGGFNVKKYNNEICITPQTYLKETFTLPDGKKGKFDVNGKPVIIGMDYTFGMPSWYNKKWQ